MQVIRVEPTPNPQAIKFVLDSQIGQGLEFKNAEDAKGHELAQKLFNIAGIDTLFFNENYVTLVMLPSGDWHTVHQEAASVIGAYDHTSEDLSEAGGGPLPLISDEATANAGEHGEMLDKVGAILQQRVVPALSADGGGLQVVEVSVDKTITIQYQGACGSCPSSIQGTLVAIENLLRSEVDPDIRVVPAGMM